MQRHCGRSGVRPSALELQLERQRPGRALELGLKELKLGLALKELKLVLAPKTLAPEEPKLVLAQQLEKEPRASVATDRSVMDYSEHRIAEYRASNLSLQFRRKRWEGSCRSSVVPRYSSSQHH